MTRGSRLTESGFGDVDIWLARVGPARADLREARRARRRGRRPVRRLGAEREVRQRRRRLQRLGRRREPTRACSATPASGRALVDGAQRGPLLQVPPRRPQQGRSVRLSRRGAAEDGVGRLRVAPRLAGRRLARGAPAARIRSSARSRCTRCTPPSWRRGLGWRELADAARPVRQATWGSPTSS